jgi:hypothetical protein
MGKITIRLPPTRDQLLAAAKKAMEAVNTVAVSTIVRRTAAGSSAGGGPFPGYTKAYAEKKGGTGRDASRVDLTLSGQMLANLKPKGVKVDARGPVGIIGFEGMHRSLAFQRAKGAFAAAVYSANPIRTRVLKDGRTITYRQEVDRYRRIEGGGRKLRGGDRAAWVLARTAKSVPMAAVVLGLSRKYDFFSIRAPAEIGRLVSTFQRVMAAEIRRLTQ